eukprot:SAG31_NODE_5560_length_2457_cov_59.927905_2_plen_135_part_00
MNADHPLICAGDTVVCFITDTKTVGFAARDLAGDPSAEEHSCIILKQSPSAHATEYQVNTKQGAGRVAVPEVFVPAERGRRGRSPPTTMIPRARILTGLEAEQLAGTTGVGKDYRWQVTHLMQVQGRELLINSL